METVTVIIPARDEERFIGACLDSVLAQTHRNLQVIVVDGASSDRTREVAEARRERDPRVELLHNPRASIPASLNMALARARGRWTVRVDAHAVVPPDYVATAVGHLRTGRWGGVGGRKDGVGTTAAGRAIAAAMGSRFGVGGSAYHYATTPRVVDHVPFGAYPTVLARALGGWDERLTANEDVEFEVRLREVGHELLLDPRMTIHWRCQQSIRGLLHQYHRYGRAKTAVARLHPGSLHLRHLTPPALVASGGAALALALARRPAAAGALLAPYLLALTAATSRVAPRLADRRSRRYVPAAFVAMHAGWGVGFWRGLPSSLRRADLAAGPGPRPGPASGAGAAQRP
jgi:succinoglycan biosynthesis protein ExoA